VKIALSEAAAVVGGEVLPIGGDTSSPLLTGVSIDSRTTRAGNLFVALRGEVHDGHDFVADAFARGAAAALVGRPAGGVPQGRGAQVVVGDPLAALTALAAHVRDVVDPFVVGVTGSVGKTTTKDLIAAVLGRRFRTVASLRSFNNDLGVPLTLLAADPGTEVVVCEMGARGPGHIAALCRYVRPHVGVVTNVGVTHYAEFGSRQAIAAEKAQLVRALPEFGAAVLNADDPAVAAMGRLAAGEVVTYGLSADAYLRATDVAWDRLGRPELRLRAAGESAWVALRVSGRHQVSNALAAAAAGIALGVPLDECARGLASASVSPWRMEVHEGVLPGVGEVVVVNDAYNASPASMASALETCARMVRGEGGLVAVLGMMAELGDIAPSEHERVGALAAALARQLVVVGERAAGIATGARAAGLGAVRLVAGVGDVAAALGDAGLRAGDVVLVKASRVAGLESAAEALVARLGSVGPVGPVGPVRPVDWGAVR
jgi:UDP-N-acetylmuramoyl-tripeptide--D-alanyl-D-alanine ligase